MNELTYENYINILREELIPALGCTEPIAIAYASAKAREILGKMPEEIIAECSRNIIKNVKGVIVPTTGDMRGIDTCAVLGALAGRPEKKLEVLTDVRPEDIDRTRELLGTDICKVKMLSEGGNLHIRLSVRYGTDTALVEILDSHTNIVRMERNGETLFDAAKAEQETPEDPQTDRDCLNIRDIYDFANTVNIEDIRSIIDPQIEYNTKIAEEGLHHKYGANVGEMLLKHFGEDVKVMAKAYPAAGSDARMSGCVMPVVINSGSGNQGMTVSLPVIVFARSLKVSEEKLYRALVFSNLTAIRQKTIIGKLSAYCGVVSAACGSGAGISYLHDAPLDVISKTITNTLANVSGIICDGAKPSCAAKVASAVDAAIMAHYMAMDNKTFGAGEGLVKEDIEKTIKSFGLMGRDGMKETDRKILDLMIDEDES